MEPSLLSGSLCCITSVSVVDYESIYSHRSAKPLASLIYTPLASTNDPLVHDEVTGGSWHTQLGFLER